MCSTVTTQRIQSDSPATAAVVSHTVEKTLSVSTQTSDFPLSPGTDSSLTPLQPVPCVKTALRVSKFNRLEDQTQLIKEVTLVVGTKVIWSPLISFCNCSLKSVAIQDVSWEPQFSILCVAPVY